MNMKIDKDTKYCLLVYIVQPIIDLCAKFQDDRPFARQIIFGSVCDGKYQSGGGRKVFSLFAESVINCHKYKYNKKPIFIIPRISAFSSFQSC